jgi:NADH-quinone oxidoreductase subunit A
MQQLYQQYLPIVIFLLIASALAFALLFIPFIIAPKKNDKEKLSQYECGFDPIIDDQNSKFDIKFCLISILFIIFDLEIAFLFPWAILMKELGTLGFVSMMSFLAILTIGFIYEWKKGALN